MGGLTATRSNRQSKEEIREDLLRRKRQLSDAAQKNNTIQDKVLESDLYRGADSVLVYVAKGCEAETDKILQDALGNKSLFVPVTVQHPQPGKRELQISEVNSLSELRRGSFRVPEPRKPNLAGNLEKKAAPELLVVPGVAFSEDKDRLGYGSGYFDRYLSQISSESVIVGLAYEQQVVKDLPVEEHDIAVDYVITGRRTIS